MIIAAPWAEYDRIIIGARVGGTACDLAQVKRRKLRVAIIEPHVEAFKSLSSERIRAALAKIPETQHGQATHG